MNGWAAAVLGLIVVVNPPGVSRAIAWGPRADPAMQRTTRAIIGVAGIVLIALVLITGPLLGWVDVSTPTFRLGASVVMGLCGGRWMLSPVGPITESAGRERTDVAVGLTLLLGPGPVLAAMSGGGDAGLVAGVVAVVAAVGLTAATLWVARASSPVAELATRLIGAVAIVVAVAIGLDSVRTV